MLTFLQRLRAPRGNIVKPGLDACNCLLAILLHHAQRMLDHRVAIRKIASGNLLVNKLLKIRCKGIHGVILYRAEDCEFHNQYITSTLQKQQQAVAPLR